MDARLRLTMDSCAGCALHNLRGLCTDQDVACAPGSCVVAVCAADTISIQGTGYPRLNVRVPPIPRAEALTPTPQRWCWVWVLWEEMRLS